MEKPCLGVGCSKPVAMDNDLLCSDCREEDIDISHLRLTFPDGGRCAQ